MGKGKKRTGERGAVTVFLAIVLVPCIIFVCAFGDVSRVQLSKARASSAADLALYSLMSHYDDDLQEYYGLVASCQTIEEFYDATEKYFLGMMSAAGMDDTGSDLFIEYMNGLKSGDITDFLQVDVTSDITVSEASNGAVGGNPALIEDSIVEFMKYRGPVEIVTNLVERFSKMDLSGAEDADANQKVANAKTEAAEAEGELLKAALYSYLAMKQYQDYYSANDVPSISKYGQYASKFPAIWSDYEKVTDLITKYYAGTKVKYGGSVDLKLLSFPMYGLGAYSYEAEDIGTKVIDDSGTHYCINNDDLDKLLKNIDSYIQEVEGAQQRIVDACASLPQSLAASEGINNVRYSLTVQKAISSSDLNTMKDTGKELMQRYAKLKAAKDCEPYPEVEGGEAGFSALNSDWENQINRAMSKIASVQGKYYTSSATTSYMKLVNRYNSVAKGAIEGVDDLTFEFYSDLLGRNATIGQFNEEIKAIFEDAYDKLDSQYDRLSIILNGGEIEYNGTKYTVVSLQELLELAQEYSEARDEWGSTAQSAGTEYGDSEYEEYTGGGSEAEQLSANMASAIDEETVNHMIERVTNIMNDIDTLSNAMDNFTYGGQSAVRMNGREDIIKAGCTVIDADQSLYLSENETAAQGYHNSLIQPPSGNFYTAPTLETGETGNNPDLNTDCEFYRFLNEALGVQVDEVEETVKENDKKTEEYQEKADKAQEEAQGIEDKYLRGKGGDISDTSGGSGYSNLTGVTSLISIAKNIAGGNVTEIRDQVYVCEYIMDMFSYSSFNNEGEYELTGEKYTLTDFGEDGAFPDSWDAWNTDDPTAVYDNQSLTNRQINSTNNQANLAEVEYVLYGNGSSDENLKSAYRNIYEIRLAMNLASGFVNFYTPNVNSNNSMIIEDIAVALAGASCGIIPIPLTKCLLIGVLAIIESAHDLARLKAGIPVALYKMKEENWFAKLSASSSTAVDSFDGSAEPVDKNGLYYSDYIRLFLVLGLTNSGTYESMLKRTGDLIQANMRLTDGNSGFDLSKARCYFQISGTLKVKPLFLTLPIVSSMEGVDPTSLLESTTWCSYDLKIIRGYS